MNVIDFCKEFERKNGTQREYYIDSIIKTKYIPYTSKLILCENIANKSLVKNELGKYYLDMGINKINYIGIIIAMYTELEYTKDENGNPETIKAYDALKESGALNLIIKAVGEDVEELLAVNKSCMDAIYQQYCSTEAFINRQIDKITVLLTSMNDGINKKILEEMSNINKFS